MKASTVYAVLGLLVLASGAAPAPASQPVHAQDVADASEHDPEAWKDRLRQAYQAIEAAHVRHVAAQLDYREMRHRRDARGDAKVKIVAELEDAERELEQAERELEELLEAARRAGIAPGVLRELERERQELDDPDS